MEVEEPAERPRLRPGSMAPTAEGNRGSAGRSNEALPLRSPQLVATKDPSRAQHNLGQGKQRAPSSLRPGKPNEPQAEDPNGSIPAGSLARLGSGPAMHSLR